MLSFTFIIKMQVLEKWITDKAVSHFTCCFVSSHSTGSHCEGTVLQVILQYYLFSVSGKKYPELVENAVVLMLQATQQTLLRMFCGSADGNWCNILAVLLTSFHISVVWLSNLSSHCYGKQFPNGDNIVTAVPLKMNQVMPKIFSAFHIVGSEP